MEFSLATFASGLSADPGHGDQGADEEWFLVEELGQAGADLAFFGRQVASVTHKGLHASDIYIYIRSMDMSQAFFEREFAHPSKFTGFGGTYEGLGLEKIPFAEFLCVDRLPDNIFCL